jgi:hypothetical protein
MALEMTATSCPHDISEQDVASQADGLCPLCLAAEVNRLRIALESLTKDPPPTLDEPDEDWEVVVKMRAIAQAALDHQ